MTAVQPSYEVTPKFVEEITMAELEADPYPFYERLRKEAPVAFVPSLGMYILSTRSCTCRSRRIRTTGLR